MELKKLAFYCKFKRIDMIRKSIHGRKREKNYIINTYDTNDQ